MSASLEAVIDRVVRAALRDELASLLRATPAPAPPPPINGYYTTADPPPGMTPRAFADACRAGWWPSFRLSRRLAAMRTDVEAALAQRAKTRARPVDDGDDERAAALGLRRKHRGGR